MVIRQWRRWAGLASAGALVAAGLGVGALLLVHRFTDPGPLDVGSPPGVTGVMASGTAGPGLFAWGDPLINHGDRPVTLISIRLLPAAPHLPQVDARAWPASWGRNTLATLWPFSAQPGAAAWGDRTYPELAGYVIAPHGDAWSMMVFAANVRGRYQWTSVQVVYRMGGRTYTAGGGFLRTLCVPRNTTCPYPDGPGRPDWPGRNS